MKNLVVMLVILLVTVVGCDIPTADELADEYWKDKVEGHSLYDGGFPSSISSYDDVYAYMRDNVTYIAEPDGADDWLNPETTLKRGGGDCEDLTMLFMNIAYFTLGVKCEFLVVDMTHSRSIEDGGLTVDHAIVRLHNGQLFDATSGSYVYYSEIG